MFNFQFAIFNLQFAICLLQFALFPLAAARAEPPTVVPIDGAVFRGELIGADAAWRLTFRTDGKPNTMPAADLVRWGRCPEQGRAGGLLTVAGGWIAARAISADRKNLTAESDLFGKFSIPLDSLAAVVFHPSNSPLPLGEGHNFSSPLPLGEGPGVRAVPRRVDAAAKQVRALLANGDELTGPLLGIADNVVRLETAVGKVEIPADRIAALLLPIKPRPSVAPVAGKLTAWLGLSDGSRLLATRLVVDGDSAAFDAAGRTWKTPATDIVFLQPLGGRAVYLSDLKPIEYRQTPFVAPPPGADRPSLAWPWRADRNVTGGPLRCGRTALPERDRRPQRRPAGLRPLPSPFGRGAGGEGRSRLPSPFGRGAGGEGRAVPGPRGH